MKTRVQEHNINKDRNNKQEETKEGETVGVSKKRHEKDSETVRARAIVEVDVPSATPSSPSSSSLSRGYHCGGNNYSY